MHQQMETIVTGEVLIRLERDVIDFCETTTTNSLLLDFTT